MRAKGAASLFVVVMIAALTCAPTARSRLRLKSIFIFTEKLSRKELTQFPQGLNSVRENSSFAPLGLDHFLLVPTAHAVGFILSPLRG